VRDRPSRPRRRTDDFRTARHVGVVDDVIAAATSLSIYRCGRAAPSPAILFRATAAVALVSSVVAFGDRRAPKKKVSRLPRVVLFAAIAQAATLGAGGLCSAWINVGCALAAGLCGFLALSVREPRSELAAPLIEEERKPRLGPPALLLFALEAMPSMGPTLTNVEFWLLFARKPCAPPLLSRKNITALHCFHRELLSRFAARGGARESHSG